MVLFLACLIFLVSEGLLFISFFWGATVITNLLSPFPCLIEWLTIIIVTEACSLLTPLHIVPEWYFLCQYAMLKAVPNKNAGFIILLTSILSLFLFGEIRNLS